jgi:thymidine kinase
MTPHLSVIVGCMFSGKSEELLRLLRRAEIAKQSTVVFKPAIDTRTAAEICSRDGRCMHAIAVNDASRIIDLSHNHDVVGIDEAQFFDMKVISVIGKLYSLGKRIIVAGLDSDFRGQPFGPIPHLLAIPEAKIFRLAAVCVRCGEDATRTYRKTPSKHQVEIGDAESYEARCFACYHDSNISILKTRREKQQVA